MTKCERCGEEIIGKRFYWKFQGEFVFVCAVCDKIIQDKGKDEFDYTRR